MTAPSVISSLSSTSAPSLLTKNASQPSLTHTSPTTPSAPLNPMTPEQQIRTLRTATTAYGATDIEAMNNRVIALDALYTLAGRNNPDHSLHHTYTGLWQTPDNI